MCVLSELFWCRWTFCNCAVNLCTQELLVGFLDFLWKKVKTPMTQNVFRQAAAGYLGSFLARASYIHIRWVENGVCSDRRRTGGYLGRFFWPGLLTFTHGVLRWKCVQIGVSKLMGRFVAWASDINTKVSSEQSVFRWVVSRIPGHVFGFFSFSFPHTSGECTEEFLSL